MEINLAAQSDQRVAIFMDTQNLYHSAKSNYRANVNYEELIRVAVNGRKLIRAFAYVIRSEEYTEEKFFDALTDIGIETRVKDLQVFHTGAKKGDWDVGIAVDMIRLTEKVDVIVLGSGDGDFLEVVRYCQSRGVRVELMAFEKTTNAKILEVVDHFTDLGDKDADFLIGNRRRIRSTSSGGSPKTMRKSSSFSTPSAAPILKTAIPYSGSNLSATNRVSGTANQQVSPTIFGRNNRRKSNNSKNGERKIQPVVGMPGKPPTTFTNKPLVNDQTKKNISIDNAFGNSEPKKKFFN